jgi:hypothetical protein
MNTEPDSLFDKIEYVNYGVKQFYEIFFLRRAYLEELTITKTYYRDNIVRLDSQNILVDLLNNLGLRLFYTDDTYVKYLNSRAPGLSRSLRLTSSFNYGEMFNGAFYGKNCNEILIFDDSSFNIEVAKKYWKNLAPVYTLLHPWSDFGFLLPTGQTQDSASGLSAININIALLGFQYRCFLLEKEEAGDMTGATPEIFLMQYVFPNMLNKQLDIVVMNRLMNLYYDRGMSKNMVKLPFPIHQYQNKVDDMLVNVLNNISNRKIYYAQILQTIPGLVAPNMSSVLELPRIANTRQVWWALVLMRMKIVKFLIDVAGNEGIEYNRVYINKYQMDLRYLISEKTFERMLPRALLEQVIVISTQILAY